MHRDFRVVGTVINKHLFESRLLDHVAFVGHLRLFLLSVVTFHYLHSNHGADSINAFVDGVEHRLKL